MPSTGVPREHVSVPASHPWVPKRRVVCADELAWIVQRGLYGRT